MAGTKKPEKNETNHLRKQDSINYEVESPNIPYLVAISAKSEWF